MRRGGSENESGVGDGHEVTYSLNHTEYRGSVLKYYGMIHLLDAERVESAFLHCGSVDAALGLGYLDFCHFCRIKGGLAVENLIDCDTAVLGYLSG